MIIPIIILTLGIVGIIGAISVISNKKVIPKQQSQTPTNPDTPSQNKNDTKKTNNLVTGIVAILLVIGIIFLISQCVKDDGTCERCNKEGVYEIGGDKFCEKHYLDVLGELIAWDGD